MTSGLGRWALTVRRRIRAHYIRGEYAAAEREYEVARQTAGALGHRDHVPALRSHSWVELLGAVDLAVELLDGLAEAERV